MDGALLAWALASFSGSVAADELYDGPYGVLSVVDNRPYKRMLYDVRDHDPTPDDLTAFLGRLQTALTDRDVILQGLTTDGSPLYPAPIRTVFGDVAHQMCTCHVLQDLTHGILRAVAAERHRLTPSTPKWQRGRPSSKEKMARRLARKSKTRQEQSSGLFQGRCLLVKRRLKPSDRQPFLPITRGRPPRRQLRELMDHLYALCDRRCRTQTALDTLKKLRQGVKRFKWIGDTVTKVVSPTLDPALTCLDDKLLPATSNAVERGNRRHRKRQKSG